MADYDGQCERMVGYYLCIKNGWFVYDCEHLVGVLFVPKMDGLCMVGVSFVPKMDGLYMVVHIWWAYYLCIKKWMVCVWFVHSWWAYYLCKKMDGLCMVVHIWWAIICAKKWMVCKWLCTFGGLLFVPKNGWFVNGCAHLVGYYLCQKMDGLYMVVHIWWAIICAKKWKVCIWLCTFGWLLFVPKNGWFVYGCAHLVGKLFVHKTGWFVSCCVHFCRFVYICVWLCTFLYGCVHLCRFV